MIPSSPPRAPRGTGRNKESMVYSDETLEETPERATRLLTGIGGVATLRTLLASVGMDDDQIREGRDFLLSCLAAPKPAALTDTAEAKAQREAVATLDEWDEPNFARFEATLRRHHPSAGEYIFNELSASTGRAAVTGVATFLTRVSALEDGSDPERQDAQTKEDDKKAVALLAKRGFDQAERARIKHIVHVALSPTASLPEALPTLEQRRAALAALRAWYDEWAAAARTVVKKKSYLIRLGLAKRKAPKKKAKTPEDETKKPK